MNKLFLVIIILVGALLRLHFLTILPPLNADEAAIGYNAYSLLQTGKDEHGNSWPIHFQSFGDYKPGGYFYIVLPFVKYLGLTELAVRLPGALFGIGSVLMIYLLVFELFKNRNLALFSGLFLAISPWHIHFSRGGWEVNAATFFIVLGVYFFIKSVYQERYLYLSFIFFVFSLYTYHAARIVTPLIVLGLLFFYRKTHLKIWRPSKLLISSGLFSLLLCIPLFLDLLGPAGLSRATGVGLFADEGPYWRTNEQRGEHKEFSGTATKLIHNKAINYGLAFVNNYLEHFDGHFLFIHGDDIQRNKVPEIGQMYLFELFFIVIGLISIAQNSKGWGIFLAWLLIAPIPAALTFQSPHALRAQNMVIPLSVISAYGLFNLIEWIRKFVNSNIIRVSCYVLLVVFMSWDFSRYLHEYYIHLPKEYPFSSQYGAREMVFYVMQNESKFKDVYITDRYDQPYILFLFYTKYDPKKFQNDHVLTPRDKFGFSTVRDFDKYHFVSIDWNNMRDLRNVLLIGTGKELEVDANSVYNINFPNGSPAYKAVPL